MRIPVLKITTKSGQVFLCEPADEADFTGEVASREELEMDSEMYLNIPSTSSSSEAFNPSE